MTSPFPGTIIGVLQRALLLVEGSFVGDKRSRGLQKLREGVAAMIAELEPLARCEPRFVLLQGTSTNLYKKRI